jgi:hypothetical protein
MSTKPVRLVGLLSIIAGLVMVIFGGVVWGVVTSELASEKITVPADSTLLPGAAVNNPLAAYAQAQIIKHHALTSSNDKTYSELGTLASDATKAGNKDDAAKYTALRTTVMNGSFLRASLFTSVLSYGVCAMAMGLGLMLGLIGWALTVVAKALAPAVAEVKATV